MSQSGHSADPQNDSVQGRLEYASLSDIGLRRSNNQDSLAVMPATSQVLWQQHGDLFVVADGMGAHAAGELASKVSTDTIPLVYHKLVDRTPAEAVLAAVEEANSQIHNRGQSSIDFRGMGTTTTALVLLPYGALLAHVGDSRAYRLRGNRLEQLTFDHSLVWEMRAAGQIQGQVPDYVPKNVITRSLGPNPKVQVDLEGPLPVASGDTFLMCSDGLSGPVKDEELGMILGSMPPGEAVRALVDLANLRGGPDNITVIVAKAVGQAWMQGPSNDMPHPRADLRPVSPLVWIAMGVVALAGLGLLVMNHPIPAALCLVAAAVLGVGAMLYRQGGEEKGPPMNGQRFGRGPYTAVVCSPSPEFVRHLAETLRELREAATEADMKVDTEALNIMLDRAAAGNQAGDYAQAVRTYCQGISFLVAEFKRQGKSRPGGSRH
ncbi:MAG: protein phosphatase 2C domain-containing protein [Thermoguttaceae bacterium]